MDNYERENRIEEALRIRNMRQVELCEKTGLSKSSINNWIKQRWQPKHNAIFLMARALDVSEMWLAGYDAPMERAPGEKKGERWHTAGGRWSEPPIEIDVKLKV